MKCSLGELSLWDEETQSWEKPEKVLGKEKDKEFTVGLGELEFWDQETQSWENAEVVERKEKEAASRLGELEIWNEEMQAWENAKGDLRFKSGLTVGLGELVLEDIKPNGLQTVINNGLDTPPKGKNFIKGLFE